MCGIAGKIHFDGRNINFDASAKMIYLQNHRGPDSQNFYIYNNIDRKEYFKGSPNSSNGESGNVFLGHARLSIIDLSTGNQPMKDCSGRYVIIYNGEIYNYIELRDELKKSGLQFRTQSDTEVILNAYKVYGQNCVKHLNGMFAFAIYDTVEQTLFCARDRLGIKPFYYYHSNQTIIFASEIKALLSQNEIDKNLNYEGIADYLTFQYTLGNKTFFKSINALLPAQTLTVGRGGLLICRYWKPELEPDYSMTEEKAVEGLSALLDDAIKIHMRSDVQIGAHLSGGIDSSAIAAILAKKYQKKLYTFTGKFDEGSLYDESPFALEVARKIDSKIFMITPTANDLVENFPKLVWHLDQPAIGPGAFPQFMVSKIAGRLLKVIMGGQGGDEIFMGYPRYLRSAIEHRLIGGKADRSIENYGSLELIAKYIQKYGFSGIAGWVAKRRLSDFDRRYIITSAPLYGLRNYFTGDLAETIKHYSPLEQAISDFGKVESSSLINRMSWYDISNYLVGLLQIEDRTGMAWSLESRVPLLDYRIVEYSLKVPSNIKLKNLEAKYLLKRAAESDLPSVIRHRKDKRGFPTPTDIWFNGVLSDYANSFVSPQKLARRGLYDSKKMTEYFASKRRFFTPAIRRELLMWVFINIELWFNLYIDQANPGTDGHLHEHKVIARKALSKAMTD